MLGGVKSYHPSPLGPDFLHWAMKWCGLWLNEHGGLVPRNLDSPDISPSATLGFRTLRALPTSLHPGVAGELHCTQVAWLRGGIQETRSRAPLVVAAFSLSSLPESGFVFPQSSCSLGKAKHKVRSYKE